MSHPSPSGSGSFSLSPSSYPLSYQTSSDFEPRPFRLGVFDDPPNSQSGTHAAPRVVEVLDSSYSKAKDASGIEASSKSSVPVVGSF